jgi:hypothetical protein
MEQASEVPVVVTVDPDRFDATVQALGEAGVHVDEALRELGTVVGRVPSERLAGLDAVDGVVHVERERRFELGPPDSDLQ